MANPIDDPDAVAGADSLPSSASDRDSNSLQSPSFQLPDNHDNPVTDSARSADATSSAVAAGDTADQGESGPQSSVPTASPPSGGAPSQSSPSGSSAGSQSQPDNSFSAEGTAGVGDSSGDNSPLPNPRPARRLIGQLPDIAPRELWHSGYANPQLEEQAEYRDQSLEAQDYAQHAAARRDYVRQFNSSGAQLGDDGRYKIQRIDPTGGIYEHDVLDNNLGKLDRRTGDIYVTTADGQAVKIGEDPIQKGLIGLVSQRKQLALNGAEIDHQVAADRAQLSDVTQQLKAFKGEPETLQRNIESAKVGDMTDPAAQANLKEAQDAFSEFKANHPDYAALQASRSQLASDITAKLNAKTTNDAAVRSNLISQDYIRATNTLPPVDTTPPASNTDATLRTVIQNAGQISGNSGMSSGAAYVTALAQAKANGATKVQGHPIDDVIAAANPARWLQSMTPQQIRDSIQSGMVTKQQGLDAVKAKAAAADQARATGDNGVGPVADFFTRAGAQMSEIVNSAGQGISNAGASMLGEKRTSALPQDFDDVKNLADLAEWFKGTKQAMQDLGQGKYGSVNPAKNDCVSATFARALGMMGALASSTEIGGPLAAFGIMMPAAAQDAYDDAKENGIKQPDGTFRPATDDEAKNLAMIAGAKVLPQILAYGVGGKLAGALESKFFPAIMNPFLRGGLRVVTGTAGNYAASTALRGAENVGAMAGIPGMETQPLFGTRNTFTTDLAFALEGGWHAGVQQHGANEYLPTAQAIMKGSDPAYAAFVAASKDETQSPGLRQKMGAQAALMRSQAEAFLKETGSSNPTAAAVSNLYDDATAAKAKAVSAQTDAAQGPAGEAGQLGAIGGHLDNLQKAESGYHAATQRLINQVPDNLQRQIWKAAAPDVDYDTAKQNGASSLVKYFGGTELGNAARDLYVSPDVQSRIGELAHANGVDPALAGHVLDAAAGARVVRDLGAVFRGESITEGKAKLLETMGLLQQNGADPTAPLRVTDDALHLLPPGMQNAAVKVPDKVRYTDTPGMPADALNKIVDMGMKRHADTARALGEPRARATEQAKVVKAKAADTAPAQAPKAGGIPGLNEHGNPVEQQKQPAPAHEAIVPNTRKDLTAKIADTQQRYAAAGDADRPALQDQLRTLAERVRLLDANNAKDRNAKAEAFKKAAPAIADDARAQVRDFVAKFKGVGS